MFPNSGSKKAAQEVELLRRENELITSFFQALNTAVNMDDLLKTIIEWVTGTTDAVTSTLYTVDSQDNIRFSYIYGVDPVMEMTLMSTVLKFGEGIVGSVIASGQKDYVPDARKDKRFLKKVDDTTGFQTKSLLCVPLIVSDEVIGAIEVINKVGDEQFTETDLELLERIASLASVALNKARLYDQLNNEKMFVEDILENIDEGVFVVGKDLAILSSNSVLADMSGGEYSRQNIVGRKVDAIFSYLDLAPIYKQIFEDGQSYRQAQNTNTSLNFRMIPRLSKQGQVLDVITVVKVRRR